MYTLNCKEALKMLFFSSGVNDCCIVSEIPVVEEVHTREGTKRFIHLKNETAPCLYDTLQ